ncbi:Glucose dehydrogenase [FAD, quinone] [Folsomia candida]|uniref:Glucose dehydrogenase [FAD, quinone] n=1 Tax=Folsomia candida TaxID=158441 RepID=A0A226EJJ9_FOLCA|nr:Glucose dehydrogenase [FAD, quinone] [Folsomia candida]
MPIWLNAEDVHGHGGEVTVQPPPFVGMAEHFIKAGEEQGFKRRDLNGRSGEGFSVMYNNIRNGRRLSSFNAFLQPIRDNPNLTIYKFSEVTKVLLRGERNEAFGVEYVRHGVRKRAFATKEVILSAGLVNSAKLLMLSGIGPKNHLDSLGIKTKCDLPAVGKNVQDHVSVFLGPFHVDKPVTMLFERDINSEAFTEFIDHGTGTLSSAGTMATALISSSYAKRSGEGNWPDLQLILLGTAVYSRFDVDFASAFHVREDILKKYLKISKGRDSFQIIVSGNRPVQRGEILLRSSDPKDEPLIDPKYLHNDQDLEVLLEGVKLALDLVENTTTFRAIGAQLTTAVFPGCEEMEFRSDDYWRCFIRQYTVSMHHLASSCSMGRHDSRDAVVDSKLRVIGAENLRVIDASVMPSVPNVNTNSPAMMIGQKGASEILKRWASNAENEVK